MSLTSSPVPSLHGQDSSWFEKLRSKRFLKPPDTFFFSRRIITTAVQPLGPAESTLNVTNLQQDLNSGEKPDRHAKNVLSKWA